MTITIDIMFFSQQPQMPIMDKTDKGQITHLKSSRTLPKFSEDWPYPDVAVLITAYLDELTSFRQLILFHYVYSAHWIGQLTGTFIYFYNE